MNAFAAFAAALLCTVGITSPAPGRSIPFDRVIVATFFDSPISTSATDIDLDGDMDIVGIASLSDDLAWWENRVGDGSSWTKHLINGSVLGGTHVRLADVDLDGDMDVLTAAAIGDEIAWWENVNGNGLSWSRRVIDNTANGVVMIAEADMDGDGDIDVAAAVEGENSIAWWENANGLASLWIRHTVQNDFGGASSVGVGDVDGDGDPDLHGVAFSDGRFAWWENLDGLGLAWVFHEVDLDLRNALYSEVADLDHDGDLDLIGASSDPGVVAWWENLTGDAASLERHTLTTTLFGADSLSAVDLDDDGDTDVLASAYLDGEIVWWENSAGDGSSWRQLPIDSVVSGAWSATGMDIDGDGDMDVLAASRTMDALAWWKNQTIHRSAHMPIGFPVADSVSGIRGAQAGDIDGDGDVDLTAAADVAGNVTWWENTDGEGTGWTNHLVDASMPQAGAVWIADLDRDGDEDIVGVSRALGQGVQWWENTGGDGSLWNGRVIDSNFAGARSVMTADMDRDGDEDVLSCSSASSEVAWWENADGLGGSWARHTVGSLASAPAWNAIAADVDKDGDPDVIGALSNSGADGAIAWWENEDGLGTAWTLRFITTDFLWPWPGLEVADVDGDGHLDVIGASLDENRVAWWENVNGNGSTWVERSVATGVLGARSVAATDLDDDGDVDIAAAAEDDNLIVWWENLNGGGLSWEQHVVEDAFDGAWSVIAADINRDGQTDLVGTATLAGDLTWWPNLGGQFAMPTSTTASTPFTAGQPEPLFQVDVAHRGRSADADEQLLGYELLLEEQPGVPLTSVRASSIFERFSVHVDNGSGSFESGLDPVIATQTDMTISSNGVLGIALPPDETSAQLSPGSPVIHHISATLTEEAEGALQSPVRITHLFEAAGKVIDAENDVSLQMEYTPSTTVQMGVPAEVTVADLSAWGYLPILTGPGHFGPTFPGDASLEAAKEPDDDGDGSGQDLGLTLKGKEGLSYVSYFSPGGLIPHVDDSVVVIRWTVSREGFEADENVPQLRFRYLYGPYGALGAGTVVAEGPIAPPPDGGGSRTYTMVLDTLEIGDANVDIPVDPDGIPNSGDEFTVPENSLTLFFDMVDLSGNQVGGGHLELDHVQMTRVDRALIESGETLEMEVTDFSQGNQVDLYGGLKLSGPGGAGVTVSFASDEAIVTADLPNPFAGAFPLFGAPVNLDFDGVGIIPFEPSEGANRLFHARFGLDASENSPEIPLPTIALTVATHDLDLVAQRFGAQVLINSLRSPVVQSDPRLTNPALDADEFTAYLHLPQAAALGTGTPFGSAINASVTLIDADSAMGGSLGVNRMELHSLPEAVLP